MPHPHDRSPLSPLYDAAVSATHNAYGPRAAPKLVQIVTNSGLEVTISVPPGWSPPQDDTPMLRCSPDCLAETLATIVQTGHRVTRAALLDEMQRLGRKRAESTVCLALEDLARIGVVDNRQDVTPKGYGLPSWE